mmetsp:Transcript_21457/g.31332  ORF Transcript_21457/g.31332 Transcript_21457/m.31332 type:complete len:134 (-) Transcript_21457:125-526(-)
MIHVLGTFASYGMSGSLWYGLIVAIFSLDSIYHICQPEVRPGQGFMRMICTFSMQILPIIAHGHEFWLEIVQLVGIYSAAGWFFSKYPLGGWSHGVFHLVAALSNPIMLDFSTKVLRSEEAIHLAAKCALMAR